MAVRNTVADVEEILEVEIDIPLPPFMHAANLIVDQVCLDSGYSDELLTEIEK